MRLILTAFFVFVCIAFPARAYYVEDGKVFNDQAQEVNLYGVSWFGFETQNNVVHGLWARNWKDMIEQIKGLGFTAIRLPFCPRTLDNVTTSSINYSANADLQGLGSLDIMDKVVEELDRQGLYILLDHHTSDCQTIEELWYRGGYSEQDWIEDLTFLADRYRDVERFFAIDIKNEPHGPATWGTGDAATDWKQAAELAASEVLDVNPDILIFVQGIQENPTCSGSIPHWWGGNLEPFSCFPLNIPEDKLVLSPHVYGPDVFVQPYFNDSGFPGNMPEIWETHFGYLVDQGYAVIIGEFGGRYGNGGDPRDRTWQDALINWMDGKGMTNFFYWSWNPNSADTGGILQDDWQSVWDDKVALLSQLMDGEVPPPTPPPPVAECSDGIDNDSDGLTDYPDDPGCSSANDNDEFNAPPGEGDLTASLSINDDWGAGYCAQVVVTNNGAGTEDWVVSFTIDGVVRDIWNARYSQSGDEVTAEGESWNNTVAPGSSVDFGFCADRVAPPEPTPQPTPEPTDPPPTPTPTPPPPVFACSDGIDNDGDGLTDFPADPGCSGASDDDEFNAPTGGGDVTASVTVNDDWGAGYCAQVTVSNPGSTPQDWLVSFSIDGTVRNMWSAAYTQSGSTVTAEGVSWNNIVQPGGTRNFGFCAIR